MSFSSDLQSPNIKELFRHFDEIKQRALSDLEVWAREEDTSLAIRKIAHLSGILEFHRKIERYVESRKKADRKNQDIEE